MKNKGTAALVKLGTIDGRPVERIIFRGSLRECKSKIPPAKKDRFRIDFKGAAK